MRLLLFLPFFLVPGIARAADAVRDPQPAPHCDLRERTFDSREIVCSLTPGPDPRRYTLRVNFSGGHDDTMARMAPMLNGAALRCDEESKTELMGEDGDVSLVCLFTAPRGSEPTRFATTVTWSHAEYVGYSLSAR